MFQHSSVPVPVLTITKQSLWHGWQKSKHKCKVKNKRKIKEWQHRWKINKLEPFVEPILEPAETLPKRPFDFPFNRVDFVASNSSLPLKLWIMEDRWFRRSPVYTTTTLLELHVLVLDRWSCIWSTVRPEISRICRCASGSIVPFHLQTSITIRIWSVISHCLKTRRPICLNSCFLVFKWLCIWVEVREK